MSSKKFLIGSVIVLAIFLLSKVFYILPIHGLGFFATIVVVIVADVNAGLWVLGKKELLNKKTIHLLHNLVNLGLLIIVTSGVLMFIPKMDYLLGLPAFMGKMAFVLALIINSFVIARHMDISTTRTFASLSKTEKRPLFISGLVSTVSWIGAFVLAGFLEM